LNELSININIAGRSYPLTVTETEEETVRTAGKLIQEKLLQYAKQFDLKDQRDALAMLTLELATENLRLKAKDTREDELLDKELSAMQQLLSNVQL
jgi:cell division protein ZapA